jgi:hypothetical protein
MASRRLMIGEMSEAGPMQFVSAKGTAPRLRGSVKVRSKKSRGKITGQTIVQAFERLMQHRWLANNFSTSGALTGGVIYTINDFQQGVANAERLANQTRFTEFEYCLQPYTECISAYDAVRIVVFLDSQPEGNLPTISELFCSVNPFSCFNPDLVGNQAKPRFRILANHLVTASNPGPFTANSQFYGQPIVSGRLKLNFTTTYEGDAGTVSDIQTNGLFWAFISASTSTVSGHYCLKYLQ